MKRLLAMLLALVMVLSMLPVAAFAEETLTLEEILEETIPEETIPEETIPEETIPEETIPEETVPEETVPEETIPEETIPEETIPEETVPGEGIPEETIPEETLPEETIPEETVPEETVPKKNDAEVTVTASGWCGSNVRWTLTSDGTLTISGTGATSDYYSSGNTHAPWYKYEEAIISVVIEEGVTAIGKYVFYDYKSIEQLTLPQGLQSIGDYAFNGCEALTEVTIPSSVKTIGRYVFSGTGIKKVTVNGMVGRDAFEDIATLEEVVFGDTATTVGYGAFSNCQALTKVTFGSGITAIDQSAFSKCVGLTEVTLTNSKLKTIGLGAFFGCENLTKVALPDSVTTINMGAFKGCTALESINIPASLTNLGEGVFSDCVSLSSIEIPNGVTAIYNQAFYNCYSLTEVKLPENLQTIGQEAFYGCFLLQDIQIPNTVTSIGEKAFYDCESLSAIDLPEGLKTVSAETFALCFSLMEVKIPENITTIYSKAFNYCNNLVTVTIPESTTRIGANAFAQCLELRHVLYTGTQDQWQEINIADGNDPLEKVARHYNAQGDEVTVIVDENGRSGYCTICNAALDLSTIKIQGCIPMMEYEFTYTGSYIRPQIVLYSGAYGVLTEGEDYTLAFKNNKNVGTGKVTITGKGIFTGSMTQEFYIYPRQVQNVRVTDTTSSSITYTYDKVPEADYYGIYQGSDMVGRTSKTTYTLSTKIFSDPDESIEINIRALTKVGEYYYIGQPSEVIDAKAGFNLTKRGTATLEYTSVAYDGTAKEPSVTVKNSSEKTINSRNYTLAYENNVNIGTATVTITGIRECAGQKVKTFKIVPQQVTGVEVTELNYNSATITFQRVEGAAEYWIYKDGDRVAEVEDTTYTFTGLSAGKTYKFSVRANATIDGEDYTGKASETVSAKPFYRFEDCSLQVNYATKAYTGKSVTNTFTIKNPDGKTLKKDEDYKVTYENNKNVGTATATITGKGKYTGTLTATFDIVPPKMGTPKVKVEQLANGTALYVTFKDVSQAEWFAIYLNGELYTKTGEFGHFTEYLEPGSYRVTVAAGVTIDGKDYIGAASDSVKVTARNTVANCNVVLDQTEFVYIGKSHKPVATVYGYDGEVLTEGVDYTVSYKNNKSTGKGYALITGKGSYNGTTKAYFTINPAQVTGLKVSSTTKTSVKISYTKASSDSTKYYGVYVDGQYVGRTTSSSYTIKGLELGKTYDVYVIPEKTVSGTTYYGEASQTITVWPGTGIGDYKATLEYTTATYTGEAFEPAITVKTSSKSSATTLTQGVDYIVTYENNAGPGKAKVIIRGIGGYTGTITKTFTINPGQVTGVTATNMSKTTIQVSYDPVPGATQYWVYVGGERKVKTVDTTCIVSGLKNGKAYKITVKAVAAVDGTNYSGALSETVKITAQEPVVQKPDETDPNVMTYAEFMAAPIDSQVVVETYVQAAESWWDGHVWLYTQNEEGAYYIFEMDCTEEDAKKLIPGTKLRISGYKSAWFGEIEIIDATFEILEGHYIATATDVTALLGTDGLADHMNKLAAFKGLTVAPSTDTEGNEAAFLYRWDGSGTRGDDLYFNATNGEKTYTFNLNAYMIGTGADSAVYQTIENLQIGDVIDIEGFLYWYEEAMPHVTAVTVVE